LIAVHYTHNMQPLSHKTLKYKNAAVAEVGDRLATIDMGRKLEGAVPLFRGAGFPSNTVAWAEAYLHTKCHLAPSSRWTTIHGPKSGGMLCPLFGGDGSPYNTMWPGPRPTSMPSFILIHSNRLATIHQHHRQTDRTDRQRTDSRANHFTNGLPKTQSNFNTEK